GQPSRIQCDDVVGGTTSRAVRGGTVGRAPRHQRHTAGIRLRRNPGDRAAAYRPHPVRAREGTRGRDTAATTTAVVAAAATGQLGTADDYRNHRPAERTT